MRNRAEMKKEAKSVIKGNFKFFILAVLPASIAYYLTRFPGLATTIGMIFWAFTLIGLSWMCLNMINDKKSEKPLTATLDVFSKKYFWPVIKLYFALCIRLIGWTLLLIVPGIIKSIEYSQSFFILKEHIDNGENVTSSQCIEESKNLMHERKGQYFVLILSFIGWSILLGMIVSFIANVFGTSIIGLLLWFVVSVLEMILFSYIYFTQAIYYTELVKNK